MWQKTPQRKKAILPQTTCIDMYFFSSFFFFFSASGAVLRHSLFLHCQRCCLLSVWSTRRKKIMKIRIRVSQVKVERIENSDWWWYNLNSFHRIKREFLLSAHLSFNRPERNYVTTFETYVSINTSTPEENDADLLIIK